MVQRQSSNLQQEEKLQKVRQPVQCIEIEEVLLKQASQAYDCLCEEQLAVHVVEQMPVACLFEYMA